MGSLLVKVANEKAWRCVIELDENPFTSIGDVTLIDAPACDKNADHIWQYYDASKGFSKIPNHELLNPIDSPIHNNGVLTYDEFSKIELAAYYEDGIYYIQKKVDTKSVQKKNVLRYIMEETAVQFEKENSCFVLLQLPDVIYNTNNKLLYFFSWEKVLTIFPFGEAPREATVEESETFRKMNSSIFDLGQGFEPKNFGKQNRIRIKELGEKYASMQPLQKEKVKQYINKYVSDRVNSKDGVLIVESDTDLKLVLFGMQGRMYQNLVYDSNHIAVSTTNIDNIKKPTVKKKKK